jgi:hypothetical protein
LESGEDIGGAAFTNPDWQVGDTFKTAGVRYEITNVMMIPEE